MKKTPRFFKRIVVLLLVTAMVITFVPFGTWSSNLITQAFGEIVVQDVQTQGEFTVERTVRRVPFTRHDFDVTVNVQANVDISPPGFNIFMQLQSKAGISNDNATERARPGWDLHQQQIEFLRHFAEHYPISELPPTRIATNIHHWDFRIDANLMNINPNTGRPFYETSRRKPSQRFPYPEYYFYHETTGRRPITMLDCTFLDIPWMDMNVANREIMRENVELAQGLNSLGPGTVRWTYYVWEENASGNQVRVEVPAGTAGANRWYFLHHNIPGELFVPLHPTKLFYRVRIEEELEPTRNDGNMNVLLINQRPDDPIDLEYMKEWADMVIIMEGEIHPAFTQIPLLSDAPTALAGHSHVIHPSYCNANPPRLMHWSVVGEEDAKWAHEELIDALRLEATAAVTVDLNQNEILSVSGASWDDNVISVSAPSRNFNQTFTYRVRVGDTPGTLPYGATFGELFTGFDRLDSDYNQTFAGLPHDEHMIHAGATMGITSQATAGNHRYSPNETIAFQLNSAEPVTETSASIVNTTTGQAFPLPGGPSSSGEFILYQAFGTNLPSHEDDFVIRLGGHIADCNCEWHVESEAFGIAYSEPEPQPTPEPPIDCEDCEQVPCVCCENCDDEECDGNPCINYDDSDKDGEGSPWTGDFNAWALGLSSLVAIAGTGYAVKRKRRNK